MLLLSAVGDLDGISEAWNRQHTPQASFSRDMEREADAYAQDALQKLVLTGWLLEALGSFNK